MPGGDGDRVEGLHVIALLDVEHPAWNFSDMLKSEQRLREEDYRSITRGTNRFPFDAVWTHTKEDSSDLSAAPHRLCDGGVSPFGPDRKASFATGAFVRLVEAGRSRGA